MTSLFIKAILLIALGLFNVSALLAQQVAKVTAVTSNVPDAVVMAGTGVLGRADGSWLRLPSGTNMLTITPPNTAAWDVTPVRVEIPTGPDSSRVVVNFPFYYRFESIPFGATVSLTRGSETTELGITPTTYVSAHAVDGIFLVSKLGYVNRTVEPGRELWNRSVIHLETIRHADDDVQRIAWMPPSRRRAWIDYVSIGSAVVAGAVAVHYKFKADRRYETYRETGDPGLRSTIRRYDVYSGVAVGAMQVGLGIFVVRLVIR